MTYSAGQVVEVCSERSRKWTSGFKYGSKITLTCLCAGRWWEAVTATGVKGIISEEDFRPLPEHGPIRTETVTVRRLEPGVYGPLNLLSDRSADSFVRLALVRELHNSAELRELARVALEIAEYLDAQ